MWILQEIKRPLKSVLMKVIKEKKDVYLTVS